MFCAYCGLDYDGDVPKTEEHIVPFALGGSNSSADRLRHHIGLKDYSQVRLYGGAIWPYVDSIQRMLGLFAKPEHHRLAILDGRPGWFMASLFGEFGCLIQLEPRMDGELPKCSGQGLVWQIELPSRQLRKMTMTELYDERAAEIEKANPRLDS